jgi:hypothetical protein
MRLPAITRAVLWVGRAVAVISTRSKQCHDIKFARKEYVRRARAHAVAKLADPYR